MQIAETVRELAEAKGIMCHVLSRVHRGKGGAVSSGIAHAIGSLIGFCDVDLSVSLSDFEQVIAVARDTRSMAIASRGIPGTVVSIPESRLREFLGRLYNHAVRLTVVPGIADTQCGAKVAPREIWHEILGRSIEAGWAWDVEILSLVYRSGYLISEVPITWSHDPRSRIKLVKDGIDMLIAIPRILWHRHVNIPIGGDLNLQYTSCVVHNAGSLSASGIPAESSVFDKNQAATLIGRGDTHWWFESKARLLTAELRRGEERQSGLLVDIGAGSGEVTRLMGGCYNKIAVEPSAELVSEIHKRGMMVVQASGNSLPFADHCAAVVTLLDIIEHLEDPIPILREAQRILNRSGTLLISVPAHQWLWSSADEFLGHFRRYSLSSLQAQVEEAGFDVVSVYHVFSWLVPIVWLARRIPGRTPEARLGLQSNGVLTRLIAKIVTMVELRIIRVKALPFGTTIIASARPRPSS